MSRYEKKLKDKLDDEIKLAGLEALVLEELEKHLILNSDRFANFRGCVPGNRDVRRGEVWLKKIRDFKPSDTGSRGHSDPMDDVVNSPSSGKGTGSSSPRDGFF